MARRLKKSTKPKIAKPKRPIKKVKKTRAARKSLRNSSIRMEKKPSVRRHSEKANNRKAGKKWSDSEEMLLNIVNTHDSNLEELKSDYAKIRKGKKFDLKELKTYLELIGESADKLKEIIADAKKYGFWGTADDNIDKTLTEERLKLFAKRDHKLETGDPYS